MERLLTRTALSGQFMMLSPSPTATAVIANGQLYFVPWDLSAPITIDQTLIECVTTPGAAGSVVRGGWWRDDGTKNRPGALIADIGTVDTTTTGLKTFAQTLTLPAGRVWCGVVPQGAPATNPTLRTITVAQTPLGMPSMASIINQFLIQTGVTAALPDPAVVSTSGSVSVASAVRLV